MQTNAMIPISCSFDTDYNTDHDMTIQEGGTVSDTTSEHGAQFEFDIVMRADANLIQEFSGDRVIGDMHYFTVRLFLASNTACSILILGNPTRIPLELAIRSHQMYCF